MAEPAKLPVENKKSISPAGGWRSFESLRREIDRLFDELHFPGWYPPSHSAFDIEVPKSGRAAWHMAPAVDLIEKETEFEITAELPGIDEKNIEIRFSDHTLTIKGEKTEEHEEMEKEFYLSERRYGSFQRSFRVPEEVNPDKIEAHFVKGVLTVKLPKSTQAQKTERKISVIAR